MENLLTDYTITKCKPWSDIIQTVKVVLKYLEISQYIIMNIISSKRGVSGRIYRKKKMENDAIYYTLKTIKNQMEHSNS